MHGSCASQNHVNKNRAVTFPHTGGHAPDLVSELGYAPGFRVLPKRWIVERTFTRVARQRRMSKDCERLASTAEVFIYLVGIRLPLARLAQP
jgi:transposase